MTVDEILSFVEHLLANDAKVSKKKRIMDEALQTFFRTDSFTAQCKRFLRAFNTRKKSIAAQVQQGLANDPAYTGMRRAAVDLARRYELADIAMGGKGSGPWGKEERSAMLQCGKFPVGYHGHHASSVLAFPYKQGDPNNIRFFRFKQHLDAHGGDFRNPTEGRGVDRDHMLRNTNMKRVVQNEVRGFLVSTVPDAVFDTLMTVLADSDSNKKETLEQFAKSAFTVAGCNGLEYFTARLLSRKS